MDVANVNAIDEMPSASLQALANKCLSGERLSFEEGLSLLNCSQPEDIQAVCHLADMVRREKVGDVVHFASSLFLYPTNLCELNCQFCSFYAKPGWKKAWFLTPEQAEAKILQHGPENLTEIHIVGGLWRDCNLDYYQDLFGRIKRISPHLHIKALTPVEYDFLAKLHNISIEQVFLKMMEWGLGSLPGGGAEILVEDIRRKLAPGKISSDEFLAIHALAHRLGLHSNITMLFNHIESHEDILTHLCKVRDVQDQTGKFRTFIPLKFGQKDNALGKRIERLKAKSVPLVYAVSRLMLDNIRNLKVLWNYVGVEEGLELLDCGANDFSSTNTEEKVIAMAGGVSIKMDRTDMMHLIRSKQRIPYLTHSGAT
ncbi:MAG: CofH family radical SAM protein [Verrucomicrobia bacterium]|nr:CofH family radical SAM protein [Verrucomicrobiota bacterium]MBS0646449.1 CofH family radical SAM protein [Verrucomicrobiota bacterium]